MNRSDFQATLSSRLRSGKTQPKKPKKRGRGRISNPSMILALMTILIASGAPVLVVSGSSHREAPRISQDPAADITDVYAFRDSIDPSKVNFILNFYPFQEPNAGPNFYSFADDVLYQVHIENNGDAQPDITYSFIFKTETVNPDTFLYNTGTVTALNDPDLNVRQFYDVWVEKYGVSYQIGAGLQVPPVNIGPASTPNYEALAKTAVHNLDHGTTVFAGQRDDPFYVDLGATFDVLTIRVPPGNQGGGVGGLSGFNVSTIAIQAPIADLTKGDSVIGVWGTTNRKQVSVLQPSMSAGSFRQVSRLGMPLVNEVVIPLGQKDTFNMSSPQDDAQFLPFVFVPELARLLNLLYGDILGPIDEAGRQDLVTIFLTGIAGLNQQQNGTPSDMLRLNTDVPPCEIGSSFELEPNSTAIPGICHRLGLMGGDFAGFPNGRRLADDVVDAVFRAVGQGYGTFMKQIFGFADKDPNNLLGDGVDTNDVPFLNEFPYVGTPHAGFVHKHGHGTICDCEQSTR